MTIVVPTSVVPTGSTFTTSGTAPYVDTDDDDTSYIQLDAINVPGGVSAKAYLPATTVCAEPSAVTLNVKGKWIGGTGTDFAAPSAYLRTPSYITTAQDIGEHYTFDYATDELAQTSFFPSSFGIPDLVASLAAGDLYVQLNYQWLGYDAYAYRITHIFVDFACGVPPLRQNQRDDIRQGQRTSRQLTVRQVGYL